jgi:hypothetical protein
MSSVIEVNLADRKDNLLTASHQLTTQKNLGATFRLAQYAQSALIETLFNTYQQLVKDTYKIGRVAKLSRLSSMIYRQSGLLCFMTAAVSWLVVEHSPTPVIQVATLKDDEELNRQNLRKQILSPDRLQIRRRYRRESVHYGSGWSAGD